MNEKELDVKLAEFNLRSHQLRVREAFVELETGTRAIKAKADSRIENLKAAYELSKIDLEEAEIHLQDAREKQEKNFD
jgi:hypothetical protein